MCVERDVVGIWDSIENYIQRMWFRASFNQVTALHQPSLKNNPEKVKVGATGSHIPPAHPDASSFSMGLSARGVSQQSAQEACAAGLSTPISQERQLRTKRLRP